MQRKKLHVQIATIFLYSSIAYGHRRELMPGARELDEELNKYYASDKNVDGSEISMGIW